MMASSNALKGGLLAYAGNYGGSAPAFQTVKSICIDLRQHWGALGAFGSPLWQHLRKLR